MNPRRRPVAVVRRAELRELDVALEGLAHPAASATSPPDFCLVHESVAARFLELLKQRVQRFYGADAQQSRQAAGTRVAS